MKKLFLLFSLFISFTLFAQNQGDTVWVSTFNYSQTYGINQWSPGIRDSVIQFPNNSGVSYSKILMYYNIRCKDGLVSPPVTGQTNIGCGEWDVNCHTYIHDSSRVDSVLNTTAKYWISNFTGTSFAYRTLPMNSIYRHFLKNVVVDSTLADTVFQTTGTQIGSAFTPNQTLDAKHQYLFTQAELSALGVTAGNLSGITLYADTANGQLRMFRIKIKPTSLTVLSDSMPELSNFTECFFNTTALSTGANRFQFYNPFVWNGTDNLLVELSYSNQQSLSGVNWTVQPTTFNSVLAATDNNAFVFNGSNYIKTQNFKGIPGSKARTIEAWIKTKAVNGDLISWGKNEAGKKWIFSINATGCLRVEVNGGYSFGNQPVNDGQWHHVAMVLTGTDMASARLYIDGVMQTGLTVLNIVVNSDTSGVNCVLSQGFHSRFFKGEMDEIRVWDTALSSATLLKWMRGVPDASHPQFSHLQLYYKFNDNGGTSVQDFSGNNRVATINSASLWSTTKGSQLFNSFTANSQRLKMGFIKGQYLQTVSNDTLFDSIPLTPNQLIEYQIISHSGSLQSDVVSLVTDTLVWAAGQEFTYHGNTNAIVDSVYKPAEQTVTMSQLAYYGRYPMKFEIMSFVTPYGINLDLGPNGKTWTFDVTDFAPVLKGIKRMTVAEGGQWMEDMDIRFAFIVGTPTREVLDVRQIWRSASKSYADIIADKVFEKRQFKFRPDANAFMVKSVISGHGQEGEFIPQTHLFNVNEGTSEFSWQVWKECANNPIFPQGGTWIYDRAGWCPGAPTFCQEMDITSLVSPGQNHWLDYSVSSASGASNYFVSNQLVSYSSPNYNLDASLIDIAAPTDKVEYSRANMICTQPTIKVQNTGTTALTSIKIKYWINNSTQPNFYTWTGSIAFMQKQTISLPSDAQLWNSLKPNGNVFHAQLVEANGAMDQNSYNNLYHSIFSIPDVIPSKFIIMLYTNSAPGETSYRIVNEWGTTLFTKNNFAAKKIHRDTFNLGVGCYQLIVEDSDDDGLSFFANSDGNGYINIRRINNAIVKSFEPDFGKSIVYNFTVDYPLAYETLNPPLKATLFPNPSTGVFNLKFNPEALSYSVVSPEGKILFSNVFDTPNSGKYRLDLSDYPDGLYMVRIKYSQGEELLKVMKTN